MNVLYVTYLMKLVKMLARNPLASTTIHATSEGDEFSAKAGYETLLLENTLAKIGALMQVGFGAAGAEIIVGLEDTPYGSREYAARDLEGHVWSFGNYAPELK